MSSTPQRDNEHLVAGFVSSTPQDDNKQHHVEGKQAGGEEAQPEMDPFALGELSAIWPGEPPEDQRALWAGMSQAHRMLAVSRLGAITAYEAGGSRNASDVLEGRNISLPRFYSILGAWRRDRSLLALVPQASRRAPRAFTPPPGIEDAAAEAVKEFEEDSAESIAERLHKRFERPSLSWIRKLVGRARRDFERELAGGSSGFLSRMMIDSTALPLPLLPVASDETARPGGESHGEVEYEWAVTALVWDAATGFIVGRALKRAPADMALHAAAAADASDGLRRMATTCPSPAEPEIVTTMPLDTMETMRVMRKLASEGAKVIHAARAPGSEMMRAFDGRIGRLDFRPRYAADAFVGRKSRAEALAEAGRSPMTLAEAYLVIDHEIAIHNTAVMTDDVTLAVEPSAVAESLDRVFKGQRVP